MSFFFCLYLCLANTSGKRGLLFKVLYSPCFRRREKNKEIKTRLRSLSRIAMLWNSAGSPRGSDTGARLCSSLTLWHRHKYR
uniref:Secreted protein n=1 Tax=Anguilla anguilla TaxID=7936 RepID=A0A0E9X3C0_ANGAN